MTQFPNPKIKAQEVPITALLSPPHDTEIREVPNSHSKFKYLKNINFSNSFCKNLSMSFPISTIHRRAYLR